MDAEIVERAVRQARADLVLGGQQDPGERAGRRCAGKGAGPGLRRGTQRCLARPDGWTVTAVDFSEVALRKAVSAASTAAVSITTVAADVQVYEATAEFDLVLLTYLQRPWPAMQKVLESASRALAPGGTLLLVAHDAQNLIDGFGGPQDPQLLQTPTQVVRALPGLTVERADRARRPVSVGEGDVRYAIDAVVRATAPSPAPVRGTR